MELHVHIPSHIECKFTFDCNFILTLCRQGLKVCRLFSKIHGTVLTRDSAPARGTVCRGSGGRPGPPDQGNTARAAGAQRASALTPCLVQIQYIR